MIDRAKIEQFIKNMDGNKYLATIYLIRRVTGLQEKPAKLIPGSQRFMIEQSIDEFLEGKSKVSFAEDATCDIPKFVEAQEGPKDK